MPRPAERRPGGSLQPAGERDDESAERRRTRARRQRQAESLAVGGFTLLVVLGVFLAVYRDVQGEPPAAPAPGASRSLLEDARLAFEESRLEDALHAVDELRETAAGGPLEEEVAFLARELEIRESREQRARAQLARIEDALAAEDVAEALSRAERLTREFGDLPRITGQALDLLASARKSAPEQFARYDGTLVERLTVDEVRPRIEQFLASGRPGAAWNLVAGLRTGTPAEEAARKDLLARIDAAARKVGEPMRNRVSELRREGHLMVALQMLNDESLDALRGTAIWLDLMHLAEDLEDQIDAQVPEGLRPIPRQRHLPAGTPRDTPEDRARSTERGRDPRSRL